jgi:hypothetical protein
LFKPDNTKEILLDGHFDQSYWIVLLVDIKVQLKFEFKLK